MTTPRLQDFQQRWQALLVKNQWKALFTSLSECVAPATDVARALLLHQAEYHRTKSHAAQLTSEQARIAYARLTHALAELIDEIEASDLVADWQTKWANLPQETHGPGLDRPLPTEVEGIERAIALKTKIINKLRETLALEDDPIRSIRYEEQLRQAEAELAALKAKLP